MATCHFSCQTCDGSSFNNCLTCLYPRVLINSICQCQPYFDKACSSYYLMNYYTAFDFLQTFFTMYLGFVVVMYSLNVKLKYTYRIFSVFQMISFAINMKLYFNGQTQYFLRIMYRTNGGFITNNRFDVFSIQNAVCSAIMVSVLIVIFFSQYWVSIAYINNTIDTYQNYILKNVYKLSETIYFFQGKYFILFFIQSVNYAIISDVMDASIGPASIQLLLVITQMSLTIYMYKKQQQFVHPSHYPKHFALYLTFSPIVMILLPIIPSFQWVIYIIPIGLLFLVLVIGRQQKFDRWTALLYISEIIFCCIPLGVVLISDKYQAIYCLIISYLLLILSIVQCAIKYFSEEQKENTQVGNEKIKSQEPTIQNLNVNEPFALPQLEQKQHVNQQDKQSQKLREKQKMKQKDIQKQKLIENQKQKNKLLEKQKQLQKSKQKQKIQVKPKAPKRMKSIGLE